MLTVVVKVELEWGSGSEETCCPPLLLEEPTKLHLLQSGTLEIQERCLTFDRVLGPNAAQEAEQELLARVQGTLGSVRHGYSVTLLLRGWETEAPRLVPQLLQELFEEAMSLKGSEPVLSTLSLVQLSSSGKARDLLSPGSENMSVLDVPPLGLVVENASEVEVSDPRAASELYLQVTEGEGRDCPLLQVLAGEALGEKEEGSLPWIVSRLLGGNNYTGLLLRLDPQGNSSSLLQAALLGASRRKMEVKQVRPILWDAVEDARARRAGLKTLRSGLLGGPLTDGGLSQLNQALRELQAQQAPDLALQFFLAQARRQRLREQHQTWFKEELKHFKQTEEVAGDQVKGLVAGKVRRGQESQRRQREETVLRLQLEGLQAERDAAEQDLVTLYDLHVQATRARTCHVLQVFRDWQRLWEEQALAAEHHHRNLLASILQDNISLATQNQQLQIENQQLQDAD
ncbi:PREDICTED: uncharacterized protein LOC102868134 [Elephantulus edwardii]|uniref:uncharacterized protein LOC102868134 n=1 Tax=Elephantulus edwardii TaxID=28737 RepID=UPI0003F0D8D7|nr:PREDICTED: uncharacterized protein LOC102868134 [Elephantulus edwardii]